MESISPTRPAYLTLDTPRLILRQPDIWDEEALFAIRTNPYVNQYLERPAAKSREEVLVFINKIKAGIREGQTYYWAIELKNDSNLIGTICLWNFSSDYSQAEIGFELNPGYQGQGFMQEAISSVIDYGFEKAGLNSILAFTHSENIRSIRLLEKNGFKIDEKAMEEFEKNDPSGSIVIYARSRNNAFQV